MTNQDSVKQAFNHVKAPDHITDAIIERSRINKKQKLPTRTLVVAAVLFTLMTISAFAVVTNYFKTDRELYQEFLTIQKMKNEIMALENILECNALIMDGVDRPSGEPAVSVVLTMKDNATLSPQELSNIVEIVRSIMPRIKSENVFIIDSNLYLFYPTDSAVPSPHP